MDIAFVTPVVYPFVKGGVEKRIHEIGKRLSEQGHDVTVYSRHWWDGPEVKEFNSMRLVSIGPEAELYASGDNRSITQALSFALKAIRPIQRSDHDIISTPSAPYFHIFTTYFANALHPTPLVTTWHEVWDDYWYDYLGKVGWFGKLTESIAAKVPQHFVAPSKATANRLGMLGPDSEDIKIIPNGVDFNKLSNTPPIPNEYDVLYAGRLIEDKNVDMLLSAFNRVANKQDISLGIIGGGPMEESLRSQASSLDNSDRIEFLGFLESHAKVIGHMKSTEIFVSPSTREGFGITLVEAMSADCKVITVNHPYSAGSEVVGDAGFVCDPDVDSIASSIDACVNGSTPKQDPVHA